MGEAHKLRFGEEHPTLRDIKAFVAKLDGPFLDKAEAAIREKSATGEREAQVQMRVFKRWRQSAAIEMEEFLFLAWYLRDFKEYLNDH